MAESPPVEVAQVAVRVDRTVLARSSVAELADQVQRQLPPGLNHRRDVAEAIAQRVAEAGRP